LTKNISIIGLALLFALVAAAQDTVPRYETFLGYTYVRANQFNQNIGLGKTIGGFDMNGGSGQFIYNFNKHFSAVADIGAGAKGNVGVINAEDTTTFFLVGPGASYRKGHFSPYVQVLFGGAERFVSRTFNAVTDLDTPIFPVVTPANLFPGPGVEIRARVSNSQTAFAMAAGGGLDIKVGKHFSFRPVSVDYVLTRFDSLSTGSTETQNSIPLQLASSSRSVSSRPCSKQPASHSSVWGRPFRKYPLPLLWARPLS
jgi:hypothetical protein